MSVPNRAQGVARLAVKARAGTTVIATLRQQGATKVLFPRQRGAGLQAVLINTAGGVTGGDRFSTHAHAMTGADLTLTTQACERAYRAMAGQTGEIKTQLRIDAAARLDWLPQETILFEGCALRRHLQIDMATSSRLLMVEPLVFGRVEMGEQLHSGQLHDQISITRDGQPLYTDAMRFDGDIHAHMAQPFVANGAAAMASVVYVAPDAEAHLAPIRAALGDTAGASLLAPDLLVARALAPDSYTLRADLGPLLTRLSGRPLPRCWSI